MPASTDDIDDKLRAAMKVLDAETPSGYFEVLPNRTLARLEGSMQMTTSGTDSDSNSELPITNGTPEDRKEDSGLHDIRNLAAASRSRMSSRRIGTSPPVDEDLLASTSGSWKSIALPEPARMVSLPELSELLELSAPTDLKAQQKADKLAAKAEAKLRRSRPSGEMIVEMSAATPVVQPVKAVAASTVEAPLHIDDVIMPGTPGTSGSGTAKGTTTAAIGTAKGAAAIVTPMIGSRIAAKKSNRGALYAMVGLGLAAAAGIAVYVGTRDDKTQVATSTPPPAAEPSRPTAAPIVAPSVVEEPKEEPKVAVEPDPVPVEPTTAKTVKQPAKPTVGKKPVKIEVADLGNGVKPVKKDEPKKEPPKEGDPDFEQLLKDSGYQKNSDKPKLEKKSLSGGDFKTGMAGVAGRAQGCYKGAQGTASVKLTIAPSGAVSKVTVSGVGAAEASCVEAAVRGATFPAWEGGPQSFGYSYLLSE